VVGAGVSGCACALAAAEAGVSVLLVNSALDSVGSPAYGPAVWTDPRIGELEEGALAVRPSPSEPLETLGRSDTHETSESIKMPAHEPIRPAEALAAAAPGLARAWSRHSRLPADGSPVLLVDRRSVSLETKWRLENEPLVQLRQAVVTSVTSRSDGTVLVESAFGEELEVDVVVLAVGLGLGGTVLVGTQEFPGGRYGEVAADRLFESLAAQGVAFREKKVAVGARLACRSGALDLRLLAGNGRVVALTLYEADGELSPNEECLSSGDRGILPPSPYEDPIRRSPGAVLVDGLQTDGALGPEGVWLAPDGIVTGEWYLDPGVADATTRSIASAEGWWIAEPRHSVRGNVIAGDRSGGRCPREILDGVWIVGQAAGAEGYLESLESGWRLGRDLGRLRESVADSAPRTSASAARGKPPTHDSDQGSGAGASS